MVVVVGLHQLQLLELECLKLMLYQFAAGPRKVLALVVMFHKDIVGPKLGGDQQQGQYNDGG